MKTLQRTRPKYKKGQTLTCYLMLSTELIGLFVFTLYPMCWAVNKAFYYYTGAVSLQKFVGFDNFLRVFQDATYWNTWLTTIKFALYKLPFEFILAMAVALILHKGMKGAGFFRSMYYLPNVISVAIIGLIFTNMFQFFGFVNAWLVKLGFLESGIDWMSNSFTALTMLVIGAIWNTFGINVMYFLAALSNIPEEVYESARLDGAGKWTIFFKITLPMMAPVMQTIILLAINGTLHTSDYILVSTRGAPAGDTFTVMSYVVNTFVPGFAETQVNLGYGCAISLVTSVIMCIVAIVYSKLSEKMANMY